ncbi:MAG: hypothetical protein AB8G11_08570 [Saprospiraceae bacterium]
MKYLSVILLMLITINSKAMKIIFPNRIHVEVQLLSESKLKKIVQEKNGKVSERFHKHLTARTYELDSNQLVMEFYDGQGILIDDKEDFETLESVRFIKNQVGYLHPRVSYYFRLTKDDLESLLSKFEGEELKDYELVPEFKGAYGFKVFRLNNNQVIYWSNDDRRTDALLYEDIEAFAFENSFATELIYPDTWDSGKEEFVDGKLPIRFNINTYSIYPDEAKSIIKNHQLTLIQTDIQYSDLFKSNLYKSEKGYFILMEDFNQLGYHGRKIGIGAAYIFKTLEKFENNYQEILKQRKINESNPNRWKGVHMYQSLSDKYGEEFPLYTIQEMNKLPSILNFDSAKLDFTAECKTIINESLKWNYGGEEFFQSVVHPLLSYIGEYNKFSGFGDWSMTLDREGKTWEPRFRNSDGEEVFDIIYFYKDLYEAEYGIDFILNNFV